MLIAKETRLSNKLILNLFGMAGIKFQFRVFQFLCIPPRLLVLAATPVGFLLGSEFLQELLVHPHRPPGVCWDVSLLSLEEVIDILYQQISFYIFLFHNVCNRLYLKS